MKGRGALKAAAAGSLLAAAPASVLRAQDFTQRHRHASGASRPVCPEQTAA